MSVEIGSREYLAEYSSFESMGELKEFLESCESRVEWIAQQDEGWADEFGLLRVWDSVRQNLLVSVGACLSLGLGAQLILDASYESAIVTCGREILVVRIAQSQGIIRRQFESAVYHVAYAETTQQWIVICETGVAMFDQCWNSISSTVLDDCVGTWQIENSALRINLVDGSHVSILLGTKNKSCESGYSGT